MSVSGVLTVYKTPEDRVVLAEERKKPSSQGGPNSSREPKMPDDSLNILGHYLNLETKGSIWHHHQKGAFLGERFCLFRPHTMNTRLILYSDF